MCSDAALYGAIGIFHYRFRRQFLLISTNPAEAQAQGIRIGLWDFLFYASFGFVVTSSVSIAGVLLVFCYLVSRPWVPCCSLTASKASGNRLDDGDTGIRAGGLSFRAAGSAHGCDDRCDVRGVLIVMFCIHLLYFHGRETPPLRGASSVKRPQERV